MYVFFYETVLETGWVMYPLFLLGMWGCFSFCSFAFFILRNKNALETRANGVAILEQFTKNFDGAMPLKAGRSEKSSSRAGGVLIKILDVFLVLLYFSAPFLIKVFASKKLIAEASLEEKFYKRLEHMQKKAKVFGPSMHASPKDSLPAGHAGGGIGCDIDGHVFEREERNFLLEYVEEGERSVSALRLIAQLAPLLGLLGTVLGMIETFKVIALYGNSNPLLLSEGISKALLTTQAGLALAFPFLFLYVFSQYWLKSLRRRLNLILQEFV